MSTNYKNIIRHEFLKNFTKKIKTRFVLIEKGSKMSKNINEVIAHINSKVNYIIQNLNIIIPDRQIPYITLMSYYGDIIDNQRIRVFLRNNDSIHFYEKNIKEQIENANNNSHILDILVAASYNKVTISDLSCDAEIVIDSKHLEDAVVDILLDIIMFNSYSFLKSMSIEEKKQFSRQKYDFFKNDKINSFYECSNDQLLYYSLAFMSRDSNGNFNLNDYIKYWEEMLTTYYPDCKHKEKRSL